MNNKYIYVIMAVVIFLLLIIVLVPKQFSNVYEFVSTNIVEPITGKKTSSPGVSDLKHVEKESPDYSVKKPNWTPGEVPNVFGENIIDTIAYTDNCTYVLINTAVNLSDKDINTYLDEIVTNKINNYFIKINKKVISDDQIYIEGDFKNAGNELYAVGKGFFSTDKKKLYFLIFTGSLDKFEESCRPYIDETFNSFKLRN